MISALADSALDLAPSPERPLDLQFNELFRRHSRSLLQTAQRVLGNRADAEEAVQDSFLYAWRHVHRYDSSRASTLTWLSVIARSRAFDRLRARARQDRLAEAEELRGQTDETRPIGFDRVLDGERETRIQAALRSLPRSQREVMELRFWGGLSQSEVAELLDIPLGTVKTRCNLAARRLRSQLTTELPALL